MNHQFNRLSRKQKRIAIAKDALQQLKLNKYLPARGLYVLERWNPDESMNDIIARDGEQCEVCAIGAAFCSLARFNTELTLEHGSPELVHNTLRLCFSNRQMALMEYAFEGRSVSRITSTLKSYTDCNLAYTFWHRHKDATERMKAIFRNIIKNGGTFKP